MLKKKYNQQYSIEEIQLLHCNDLRLGAEGALLQIIQDMSVKLINLKARHLSSVQEGIKAHI